MSDTPNNNDDFRLAATDRAESGLSLPEVRSVPGDLLPDAMLLVRDGVIEYANAAALELFGAGSSADLIGAPVTDRQAQDPDAGADPAHGFSGTEPTAEGRDREIAHWTRLDGTIFAAEAAFTHSKDRSGPLTCIVLRRISDDNRSNIDATLLQAVSTAENCRLAVEAVIRHTNRAWGWDYGELWIRDDVSGRMVLFGSTSDLNGSLSDFRTVTSHMQFWPKSGLIGRVWDRNDVIWVDRLKDSSTEEFLRVEQARAANLSSAVGVPIENKAGEIVAVAAFMARASVDDMAEFGAFIPTLQSVLRQVLRIHIAEESAALVGERFDNFARISGEWFWETDAEHRFTFVSDTIHKQLGMAPGQIIGKTRTEYLDVDEREPYWQRHLQVQNAHEPFRDFRFSCVDDTGRQRHVAISGEPLFEANGGFRGYQGTGRDLTGIVKSAELARTAEVRLQEALQNLPVGVALFDSDDRLVIANEYFMVWPDTMRDTYKPGVQFETLVRKAVEVGMLHDTVGDPDEHIRRRLENHRNPPSVMDISYSDGRARQLFDYPTADGGTLVVSVDTTAARSARRRLRRSEQILRHLSQNAPGWVFRRSRRPDGSNWHDYSVGGLRERLGLPQLLEPTQDGTGSILELLSPDDAEKAKQAFESAIGTAEPVSVDLKATTRGGAEFGLKVDVAATEAVDGEIVWDGVVLDITDQLRLEDDAARSRQRFFTMVNGSNQAITVHRDFKLLYANPAAAQIFGWPDAETMVEHGELLVHYHRHEHDRVRQIAAARLREEPVSRDYELRGVRKDGREILLSNRAFVIDWDGAPAICANQLDITEIREAERAARRHLDTLARAQRLETVSALAAGIAHDLGQPLLNIKNYSAGALRRLARQNTNPAELRNVFERIGAQASLAGEIIHNSRSYVRTDDEIDANFDVAQMLSNLATLVEPEMHASDTVLEFDVGSDLPPVSGSRVKMEQVVLNLVRNGLDALHGSGENRGRIRVSAREAEEMIRIEVSDNGPGIDARSTEKVFEPFFSTKQDGLGLGLSICRTIVEGHGGSLELDESGKRGATFVLSIPAKR